MIVLSVVVISLSKTLGPRLAPVRWALSATLFLSAVCNLQAKELGEAHYLNPVAIEIDSEANAAYVALAGTHEIAVIDLLSETVVDYWPLPGEPTGLALDVATGRVGTTIGTGADARIVLADIRGKRILGEWASPFSPVAPNFVDGGKSLAVCHRFLNTISFYSIPEGTLEATVETGREVIAAVTDTSGKRLYAGTHMPSQAATEAHVGLTVEVFDAVEHYRRRVIDLPNGSSGLQDLAISPDGRWLFATHVIGHYQLPTNQIERGWMNANALSIIDTETESLWSTILLDDTTLGAANPWGVSLTEDGQFLAVAHSGLHEISRIPMDSLIKNIESTQGNDDGAASYSTSHDLTLMTRSGRKRVALPGHGPRSLATWGSKVLVCEYFSGQVSVVDFADPHLRETEVKTIPLGLEPPMDAIRKGELRFADARLCFQGWQSCLSCHPSVRTDGLNWDLLNDGIGNPKQSKSLLYSIETPPAMAHGVRARAEVAVRAGIRFIQFAEVDEDDAEAIVAYLDNLEPLESPALIDGELSPIALQGREIFDRAKCAECHSGQYYTDMQLHRVRHADGVSRGRAFDTPTLKEIWRTAPYLYDGRATTIEQALKIKDRGVSDLTEAELSALAEYVRSL